MADSPIRPGTVLEDGTIVGDYIGRSGGALNFYGESAGERVVVKVLAPKLDGPLEAHSDAVACLFGLRHPGLQSLIARGAIGPRHYLVYEYIEGRTLRATLAQVQAAGGAVDLETTLHVIVQASQALEVLHGITPHGVLTADNLFLRGDGQTTVANIGYARLALSASASVEYAESAYVAPEVREDPWSASEVSDVYSLGVALVALLAGEDVSRATLPAAVVRVCQKYPQLEEVVHACLADEQVMRLQSMPEVRALLRECTGLEASGVLPLPHMEKPAVDDLFGGIELTSRPSIGATESTGEDPERWITSIDGRDYGPFTAAVIRQKLTADEIDEDTLIVDLFTQESASLVDVPTFTDFVMDYLPQRAKKRIAQAERREEVVKQAKRTGATTIVASVLAVAAGAAALIAMQVENPPVPFDDIVRPYAHVFELDEPTYVEIAADDALIASLFDFSDPVPEEEPTSNSGRRSDRGGESALEEEPSLDDFVLSFDNSRPSRKLSSEEINQTIAANQSSIQRCFQRELRANPRFTGVTVSWSIVPDGRTTNTRVEAHGDVSDDATRCLRRAFRGMRFPEFNDVPMNVTIPFRLQ